jgi:hypothetical protein
VRSGKYDWPGAADYYKQAIEKLGPDADPSDVTRITELLATSFFKAAFQAGNRVEFKGTMQHAAEIYERVQSLHDRKGRRDLAMLAEARGLFARFWTLDNVESRRNTVAKCVSLAKSAIASLETSGEDRYLAEAHRDLLTYLSDAQWLASDWKSLSEGMVAVKQVGEKAARHFERYSDYENLALCYYMSEDLASSVAKDQHDWKEQLSAAKEIEARLSETSKRDQKLQSLSLSSFVASDIAFAEGDYARALKASEAGIATAEPTGNSLLLGRLLENAGWSTYWMAHGEEETERRRLLFEKTIGLASRAVKYLEVSSFPGNISWAYSADSYTERANLVETEVEKKRDNLLKAVEIAKKGLTWQKYPAFWEQTSHVLSKALYFLATVENKAAEKVRLLSEALSLRDDNIRAILGRDPYGWPLGVFYNYRALIKAELSTLIEDSKSRDELLQSAVPDMEQCVSICSVWATDPGTLGALARYEEWYGDIIVKLLQATKESEWARKAISVYENALEHLAKAGRLSALGAMHWKIAKIHDDIGDYVAASNAFKKSSEEYRLGADRAPGSASVFRELAFYMDAWGLIEQARAHHNEEQYHLASEKYTKAADMLQQTGRWKQISNHYTACSLLETGEAQSRQEKQAESIESFTAAANAFRQTRTDLEKELAEEKGSQKKNDQELRGWLSISTGRERYCLGRIELEEAKSLDRKGEREASAAKYGSASQSFKIMMADARGEQSQRELETLALFCQAWSKMKEAEAAASPDLYGEAAGLFLKTKEVATRKKFGVLALANSAMCKALESGTKFRLTRDTQLYSEVKRQLETATDYYEEAGVQNAADWTRATQRLFDALVYLADAETERDAKKKAELYYLSEKHLQLAAKLYGEAGYPSRKEEALRHLKRAREEKELLLTPIEALAENPATTEVTVAPVSLIRDQAVGLERFEGATVVGNMGLREKEVGVGSEITLELEMANVGKTAATLIKLENLAPEGFEVDRQRIPHRVEDNYIDMKGKRLEYLKTHEVNVPMRALRKGAFEIRPRVLFVDEKGNYRSYDFEPAALTVRELGISGWLKGPKTK